MTKVPMRLVPALAAVAGLATLVVTSAAATPSAKSANVQVCVLLPDTKSSVRWVQFDAPAFARRP